MKLDKKFIYVIAIVALIFVGMAAANAHDAGCVPSAQVYSSLEKIGEQRVFYIEEGTNPTVIEVWQSNNIDDEKENSWTLLRTHADGVSCGVAEGYGIFMKEGFGLPS